MSTNAWNFMLRVLRQESSQNTKRCSGLKPSLSSAGLQANWIIGGGPHIDTNTLSDGRGKCFSIISALTKPSLNFQSTDVANAQADYIFNTNTTNITLLITVLGS